MLSPQRSNSADASDINQIVFINNQTANMNDDRQFYGGRQAGKIIFGT